jgi:uncharacterized small protein (DUF1192 family)
MLFVLLVLVVLGIGIVIYALLETAKPQKNEREKNKNQPQQSPLAVSELEQKIARLQRRIVELKNELEKNKTPTADKNNQDEIQKENEFKFSNELKRRDAWVASAEAELSKVKIENVDLSNKFITKEKELNEEFAKNVDISRQLRELKVAFDVKEIACRLKEDQVQAQKHQIEGQLKVINEQLASITEFKCKEKINEWVPKVEFNELNRKYLSLEKQIKENKNQQEEGQDVPKK